MFLSCKCSNKKTNISNNSANKTFWKNDDKITF